MKGIHIEFAGGHWDGAHLYGDSYDAEEARLAKKCYWATKAGAVGEHFSELSAQEMHQLRRQAHADDHLDTRHDYVVTIHVENEREILVRLECADEDLRA
jgi:hypothetical protein